MRRRQGWRETWGQVVSSEATSTLTWYLERVARVALLSAREELDLAKRIGAADAAAALLDGTHAGDRDLDPVRRARLRRVVRDGRRAGARLTEANLRLVVSIARRYRGRGLDFLDLVQEGNLGLITAVERFDPARGFRFSTYASWWIRQAVLNGLASRGRAVRLPLHAYETARRLRVHEQQAYQTTGRVASETELADELGLRVGRLREIQRAAREVVSLDLPLSQGDSHGATVGDLIPSPEQGPDLRVDATLAGEALLGALGKLSPREREVLELRYGLDDGRPRTLEELGNHFGVTRERIRQVERRALGKLCLPGLDGLLGTAS